jgi:hypothetical protein
MIQIITGKLGAGKTLYAVGIHSFNALCKGATLCTNIAVDWEEICRLARNRRRVVLHESQLVKVDPGKDKNWHQSIPWGTRKAPVEVVLDEIHLFFNARDWATTNKESRSLLSFLTQSRKACVNVTFIAQEMTTIEKQFRVLAEWELYIVSSDHIPLAGLGKSPFKFFIVSKRDSMNGVLIEKTFKSYDKALFRLYGSYTFLDDEMNDLAAKAVTVEARKLPKVPLLRWAWEWSTQDFRRVLGK